MLRDTIRHECGQLLSRHLICRQALFLHRQKAIQAQLKSAESGSRQSDSSGGGRWGEDGNNKGKSAGGGKFGRRGYGADGDAEFGGKGQLVSYLVS